MWNQKVENYYGYTNTCLLPVLMDLGSSAQLSKRGER